MNLMDLMTTICGTGPHPECYFVSAELISSMV